MTDPGDSALPFSQKPNLGMPFPLNTCDYEQIADAVGPQAAGFILAGRPFHNWDELRDKLERTFGDSGNAIVEKLIAGGVSLKI